MARTVAILALTIWGIFWIGIGVEEMFGQAVSKIVCGCLTFVFAAVYGYLTRSTR